MLKQNQTTQLFIIYFYLFILYIYSFCYMVFNSHLQTRHKPSYTLENRRHVQPGQMDVDRGIEQSGQDWAMWRQPGKCRTETTGGNS